MTAFTGTWRLVRLALRRDRIQLPIWLASLILIEAATVSSIVGLYPDEEERLNLAITSANSPVSLMTNGLVSGSSLGATTMTQGLSVLGLGVAFMSTLAVVRHTRQNEETGRAEMIGAGIVGRHASLTAALIVVAGANIVFALLAALTLIGNDLPVASSVLAGVSLGFVGIAFGAIAAVAAQISETARGANGMAAAAIGVAFLLRAVGDVAGKTVEGGTKTISAWPSWLSPIGWSQQTRAYDDDNWWVLGLFVVTVVGLVGLAFELTALRDDAPLRWHRGIWLCHPDAAADAVRGGGRPGRTGVGHVGEQGAMDGEPHRHRGARGRCARSSDGTEHGRDVRAGDRRRRRAGADAGRRRAGPGAGSPGPGRARRGGVRPVAPSSRRDRLDRLRPVPAHGPAGRDPRPAAGGAQPVAVHPPAGRTRGRRGGDAADHAAGRGRGSPGDRDDGIPAAGPRAGLITGEALA